VARNRIHLSLRWFTAADRENGVDAYLKYWIALETLATNTTNINSLNDTLAATSKVSSQKAKQDFRASRLFDLRGRIVHGGYQKGLDAWLLKYIESLYIGALFQKIGMECERRAEYLLEDGKFEVSKYFSKS